MSQSDYCVLQNHFVIQEQSCSSFIVLIVICGLCSTYSTYLCHLKLNNVLVTHTVVISSLCVRKGFCCSRKEHVIPSRLRWSCSSCCSFWHFVFEYCHVILCLDDMFYLYEECVVCKASPGCDGLTPFLFLFVRSLLHFTRILDQAKLFTSPL